MSHSSLYTSNDFAALEDDGSLSEHLYCDAEHTSAHSNLSLGACHMSRCIQNYWAVFAYKQSKKTPPKTFTGSTGTGPPGTQRQILWVTRERKCISETLWRNRPWAANFKGCNKRQRVLPFLLCFHFAHISINERSLVIPEIVSESMFWPILAFRWLEALQGGPLMHVVMTEH